MTSRATPARSTPNPRPLAGARAEATPAFSLHLAPTTRAAREALALVGGDAGAPALADAAARDQAEAALGRLLGAGRPYFVYLRNGGRGTERNGDGETGAEQVVEIRVAADAATEAEANRRLIETLGGKSLLLVGTEKEDRRSGTSLFLLFSVRAIPEVWARKDAWSRSARVTFSAGEGAADDAGFPTRLLAAITRLPEARAQREGLQRRLADWHRYLGVLERTARARQFTLAYKSFRRSPSGVFVTFTLEPGREGIPWDRVRSALDEPLEVRQRNGLARSAAGAVEEDDSGDWLLGTMAEAAPERNEVTVALDEEVERLLASRAIELPRAGALAYKAAGDLAQIRRLKFGLELLEQGYCENPHLGDFLFDAARASRPDPARHIALDRAHLLQPRLNDGQRAAVEGALNAPDLFLIQGPPGTGKTTVIAEICYQNALRGQRTLIASQSNLAVDHALSRLVHHARIRALRRGRADRVEIEGAPFLEDQVVGTWLAKTAESCERDLAARRERVALFEALLTDRARVEALPEALRRYAEERPRQAAAVAALEAKLPAQTQHTQQVGRALARRREARERLARLLAYYRPPLGPQPTPELAEPGPEGSRWFEHPAVQQLRARLDQLRGVLAAWGASEADQPAPADDAGPGSQPPAAEEAPGLAATLAQALRARQSARELIGHLADLRTYLDELRATGLAFFRDRAQIEQINTDWQDLTHAEASLRERCTQLEARRATLAATVAEMASFDPARVPARTAVQAWADALATAQAGGPLGEPPPGFEGPLARAIWAAAAEAIQLHKLGALAVELRTYRAEAARLAELAVLLAEGEQRLIAELSPARGVAARVGEVVSRSARGPALAERRGRRSGHWRQTPLRNLVALDAQGALHPAAGAEAAWRRLEQHLMRLSQRPAWWQTAVGYERRRQHVLGEWVERLRLAAEDFSRRRADLEALARHRAARLPERIDAMAEVLGPALAQAAQTVGPQAERDLAKVTAELERAREALPLLAEQIEAAEQQLAALAQAQEQRQRRLAAGLEALGTGRPTRHFQYLLRQTDQLPVENWDAFWQAATGSFDELARQLNAAAASVDPAEALAAVAADLDADIEHLEHSQEKARRGEAALEHEVAGMRQQLEQLDAHHQQEVDWWQAALNAVPERLRPPARGQAPESAEYIQAVLAASAGWAESLQRERAYLARAEGLVRDWAQRLRAGNPRDHADLQQIYIDNANVIGITCVQAGSYHFSREYRNFDCVVVDEVSKATPPELLLPMLKGARVVLVGDHQQLPPMIGPDSLADLAAELSVPAAELEHLERSLFKELFEAAPPELRVMLTEQYRMHPQIMAGINQFYDDRLACAIPDPDQQRAHGFDLPWLKPEQHLLWVDTPAEGQFAEHKIGTTYQNLGEVETIVRLLQALDSAWAAPVAGGQPPKEVGVITFYGAQVRQLRERLLNRQPGFKHLRLRIGTVDRFQGMERPVIIVSLVRNNRLGAVGFARKPERVNVAFSRAQELLVIVGSRELFCERARDGQATAIYSRVAEVVQRHGGLRKAGE